MISLSLVTTAQVAREEISIGVGAGNNYIINPVSDLKPTDLWSIQANSSGNSTRSIFIDYTLYIKNGLGFSSGIGYWNRGTEPAQISNLTIPFKTSWTSKGRVSFYGSLGLNCSFLLGPKKPFEGYNPAIDSVQTYQAKRLGQISGTIEYGVKLNLNPDWSIGLGFQHFIDLNSALEAYELGTQDYTLQYFGMGGQYILHVQRRIDLIGN